MSSYFLDRRYIKGFGFDYWDLFAIPSDNQRCNLISFPFPNPNIRLCSSYSDTVTEDGDRVGGQELHLYYQYFPHGARAGKTEGNEFRKTTVRLYRTNP